MKLAPLTTYSTPPYSLIAKLTNFPKLFNCVVEDWGTVRLKEFLEDALADTRGHTREGFPAEVSATLIELALLNTARLEADGHSFEDDPTTGFALTKWKLPKNF